MEQVNQVLIPFFRVLYNQVSYQNQHHCNNGQLLLLIELDVLQLPVSIISNEHQAILKILYEQLIELIQLVLRCDLDKLFFDNTLKMEQQIFQYGFVISFIARKCS